jgi:hypothetical protein
MRTPNDIRLAESVPEIDLILGGHDHVYEKRKVINHSHFIKYVFLGFSFLFFPLPSLRGQPTVR